MTTNTTTVELMKGFPDFKAPGFDIAIYNERFDTNNSVIRARSKKIHYDKHWGCLSLKFALNGSEMYRTDNSLYSVNDHNFLILNHDTEYSSYIESDIEVESFTLNFTKKYTDAFFSTLNSKTEDVLEFNMEKTGALLYLLSDCIPALPAYGR